METGILHDTSMKKGTRMSSIELLRIITMLMIVFHHFTIHGWFENLGLSINGLWLNFINMGGKIGVNIFVLISGYFLISDKKGLINLKK